MKTIWIAFGATEDTIERQLRNQGFSPVGNEAARWESQRNAIILLRVGGVITRKDAERAENRILKQIEEIFTKAEGAECTTPK